MCAPPKGFHLGQNDGDTVSLKKIETAPVVGNRTNVISQTHPHPPKGPGRMGLMHDEKTTRKEIERAVTHCLCGR